MTEEMTATKPIQNYPFGMVMTQTNPGTSPKNKLLYNGKEIQDDLVAGKKLDWYDYGARFYDPQIARWHSVDPLAEKYYNHSPYHFSGNNPLRFVDLDGMSYADFVDEEGRLIGNDGIEDGRVFVVKSTESGLSNSEIQNTKTFIQQNSGNTTAFNNNSIAYDNSIEIAGSAETRQAMVSIVSADDGMGGSRSENNQEHGGMIKNGQVLRVESGSVIDLSNPSVNRATMNFNNTDGATSIFHSHPSGHFQTSDGTFRTYVQTPSYQDIGIARNRTDYVFGMGNVSIGGSQPTVYIYNSSGVQAKLPINRFVNFGR